MFISHVNSMLCWNTTDIFFYRSSSNYIESCSTSGSLVTGDFESGSFIGNKQPATSITEIPNTDSQSSTGTGQPSASASLSDQPAADFVDTASETNEANLFSRATSISKNKEKKRKLADESFNDKFQQIQSNFDKVLAAEANKQWVDGCHHFRMRAAEKLKGLPPVKRLRLQ